MYSFTESIVFSPVGRFSRQVASTGEKVVELREVSMEKENFWSVSASAMCEHLCGEHRMF